MLFLFQMRCFAYRIPVSRKNAYLTIAGGVKHPPAPGNGLLNRIVVLADMQKISGLRQNRGGLRGPDKDAGAFVIRRLVGQDVSPFHILRNRA